MEAEHAEPVAEMASLNVVSAKEAASVPYAMDVEISSVKSVKGKVKSGRRLGGRCRGDVIYRHFE